MIARGTGAGGRTGVGRGDRVQTALEGGIVVGLQEDGERSWEGARGTWSLDIDAVEVRWVDPVPQAGVLQLDTPFDKTLTMSFSRVAPARIEVSVEGPRRSFDFETRTKSITRCSGNW